MYNSPPYKDPIVQKYLDLIKDNTSGIKTFSNGMVEKIDSYSLPAVIIDIENVEADEHSNVEDSHKVSLVLSYVADVRNSIDQTPRLDRINQVREALIGRESMDSSTPYALKTNSLLYILRHNINIDSSNQLRTDLGNVSVTVPSDVASGRESGLYVVEGTIRFQAFFTQLR